MRRSLLCALAFVVGAGVGDARAQSPPPQPPVELGLDVSALLFPDIREPHWGPRLVVNFDGRNSLQITTSFQKLTAWDDAQRKTDVYLAAFKRRVYATGPVGVSATIGGGLERTVIISPGATFGNPPITFPATRGLELLPAFTTGAVIDYRLGHRVAVVFESSFVFTGLLGGRFSGGLVVPVGPYPSRPDVLASSVPWATLNAGERAWVTTGDGRETDGEVVGRTAGTLTLRTRTGMVSFAAGDVREIDTTDPIRNGTMLGLKIGAFGAIAPSILVTLLVCSLDDGCDAGEVLLVNGLLFGVGSGVGAATGALADSLRERRVPVYRRGGSARVMVAPIVSGHRVGGRAVIRW